MTLIQIKCLYFIHYFVLCKNPKKKNIFYLSFYLNFLWWYDIQNCKRIFSFFSICINKPIECLPNKIEWNSSIYFERFYRKIENWVIEIYLFKKCWYICITIKMCSGTWKNIWSSIIIFFILFIENNMFLCWIILISTGLDTYFMVFFSEFIA